MGGPTFKQKTLYLTCISYHIGQTPLAKAYAGKEEYHLILLHSASLVVIKQIYKPKKMVIRYN